MYGVSSKQPELISWHHVEQKALQVDCRCLRKLLIYWKHYFTAIKTSYLKNYYHNSSCSKTGLPKTTIIPHEQFILQLY